jgi:hypothetical protein
VAVGYSFEIRYIASLGVTSDKKIGFSYHIPYLYEKCDSSGVCQGSIDHYKILTEKLCQISEQTEMPILFGLDGFAYWNKRKDLWNWWDKNVQGYDPANKENVEWKSWDIDDAVREGWRNWGTPQKTVEPHPNIMSRKFIAANKDALKELVPIIRDWYRKLPSDKQYLFAGIKLGWETGIGSQYYYPKDESDSTVVDHPDKGYQVGFAAVKTAGLANSGELSQSDLTKCVQMHFSELAETVFQEGIPRRKIYTHAGAFDDTVRAIKYITTDAALTPFANPGWSFYTGNMGPQGLGGLDSTLNKVDSIWWANSEWGGGGSNWEKTLLK